MTRAHLARWLRAAADRLTPQPQPDVDTLRLQIRNLEICLRSARRLKLEADAAAERAYRARDDAQAQATHWLRTAGDQSEALIRLRDVAPVGEVITFGRRSRSHLRPVE